MKGIETRHKSNCDTHTGGRCNCKPGYQARAYDKATGKRVSRTFTTRTAAKNWLGDAQAAIRRGDLKTHDGPLLEEAVAVWLAGARAGTITNRSGDPFKPAALRAYEKNLRLRVLPTLGTLRLRELKHSDIQALVDDLQDSGIAASTIHNASRR
jgi:hypothetical protein